jgi:hypothetical protein
MRRRLDLLLRRPLGQRLLLRDHISVPWRPPVLDEAGRLVWFCRLRRVVSVRSAPRAL